MKRMNLLLWILQAVLALLCLSGGAYKLFSYDQLAQVPAAEALSRGGWGTLGVLEMTCAVLLIVPTAMKWMPSLTPLAAAVLTLEGLGLAALYGRYSLEVAASNPLVWSVAIALMAAFVAYGRYAPRPAA
jgi:hypothetical protein